MNDNDQLSAFPMTKVETAELFLVHFQAGVDKAEKSLDTARANLMHACQLRDIAEGNLRRMQDDGVQTVAEVAAEIVNSGALDSDGLTVTATLSPPGVDPITYSGWTCQDCGGEGHLPDKTGGGHHRCKACGGTGHMAPSCDNCTAYGDCNVSQPHGSSTMGCGGKKWIHGDRSAVASPCIVALYPGDDETHVTLVGDRTRYGELVADYFTAAGIVADVDADEWQVLAEDELTTNGGGGRNLYAAIQESDYGKRLIVAAADQGSAAG